MRIYWLNPPIGTRAIIADTAWMNFSYVCKEHEWIEPIIDWSEFITLEDLVKEILSNNPDVLCLSTYMWNEQLCLDCAQEIKRIKPDIKIIRGGPQQTIFHSIDHNCHPVGIGELYLKELLNDLNTTVESIVKQRYNFPNESTYEHNIAYLTNVVGVAKQLNKKSVINLETTRGCPYSCTYCEWGGGVGTKISQKPESVVHAELDLMSILGFDEIDILDANFGILKRDVDFVNRIANNKNIYGYPKLLLVYGVAKSSAEKKDAILDIAFKNGLMDSYSMSVQTVSDIALNNVKRTDIPLEDNLKLAKHYHETYNAFARVEIIMGMPGSTLEDFYKEMDITLWTGVWDWSRGPLSVLPATELANPLYQKLHKIKTSKIGVTENDDTDVTYVSENILSRYKSKQEVVVETYSFSKEEWKEMFFMNYAQKAYGPRLSKDQIPSIEMKKFYNSIQNEQWFKDIKSEIDLLADGKRSDKDFLIYGGKRIEEWVDEYLNGLNN